MDGLGQQVVNRDCWENAAEVPSNRRLALPPSPSAQFDWSEDRLARLARTVETEIIPRLLLAHKVAPRPLSVSPCEGATPGSDEVVEFANLILGHDSVVGVSHVKAMISRGVSLESVYLDLLAPTARHLGLLWEADLCDFTEVTVGLWRLQQVLREFSPAFLEAAESRGDGRRALLVPASGEQHRLGLFMVAEFFRRAGWEVCDGPPASSSDLLGVVRGEWFDVVGVSVTCESRLDALAADIRAIRRASRNRAVGVMVGGRVFTEHPELVAFVGADATAIDGRQAPIQAENLLAQGPDTLKSATGTL